MTVDFTQLVDTARRHVDEGIVPACQLAVARAGEVVLFEAFGGATTNTRFCIFSATKPIVSSAVWLLIGDGLLDVAARVAEYVPEFAGNGLDRVTVEHVLLHTAGFPHAPMAHEEGVDPDRRRARFATWHPDSEPGSRFAYHFESAHWVLVDLIERLSGQDFRQFIERHLTGPLGLPRVLGLPVDQQANIRCRLADEIFAVPVNRTIGLVVAGDDGQHVVRYGSFGQANSPRAFGHAGGLGQIGWADPENGVSFAYAQSGIGPHLVAAGIRAYELSTHVAGLFA